MAVSRKVAKEQRRKDFFFTSLLLCVKKTEYCFNHKHNYCHFVLYCVTLAGIRIPIPSLYL
jgi:hypothetical protein